MNAEEAMQANRGKRRRAAPTPQELEAQLAPMQSAVKWALLGLVIERQGHGYELARRFEEAYSGLLSLSSSSYVYKALGTLERRGWIEALPDEQMRGVRKTRYRSTVPGEDAFQQHLLDQLMGVDRCGALFLRKLAVFAHEPERVLYIIKRSERACASGNGTLPSAHRGGGEVDATGALAARLHAQGRELALTAMITWLQYARGEIDAHAEKDGSAVR
jgi:DNA-binding PadR family transcriptional regulator